MNPQRFAVLVAGAMLVGVGASPIGAQTIEPPAVPANLEVPAGNTVYLAAHALGTQNYICMPAGRRAVAWRFLGPEATLFSAGSTGDLQQITTHFLSVNPAEATLTRPTWQHSADTSRVWGRVVASSSDPNYVASGAIPWLLLQTAGAQAGPAGGATMVPTTFIQRVNTTGGLAPSSGCSDDDDIGRLALVPYTTEYFFYRASSQQ